MNERKNLDKLFQEKFKDFEAPAPETAWPYIEEKLKEKKKKRVIPIWWKLSGIAAALLISFALYDGLFSHQGQPENKVVIRESSNHATPKNKKSLEDAAKDSAIAASDAINKLENSPQVKGITKNQDAVAVTPESNKEPLKTNSNRIKSTIENSEEKQVAVNENKSGRPLKNRKKNFNGIYSPKAENAVAENSGNANQSTRKKFKSGKVQRVMVHKDPLESPKNNENSTQRQHENTNPDSKIAQQNTNGIKTGTDINTTNQINNQQPIATTKNADDSPVKKLDSAAIATAVPNALEELLNEKGKKLVVKGPKVNRWQITSSVAPIYFGSASGGSPIDSAFTGNSKTYKTNLSIRLGVNYAVSKKITVRAGISQVTLDYNTNDVFISAGFQRNTLGNVNTTTENQFLHFSRKASLRNATVSEAPNNLSTDEFSSSLNQKMGYIEVPVELSYAVIDRKFGLNVIGGVSTLFLNENKIIVISDGLTTDLGEANNLSKTHFSANAGLGIRYRFFRAFQANFEPMFKYQLNTFSKDAGNFKPYYFGLYTGLSFSF